MSMIFFPTNDFKYREWAKQINKMGYQAFGNKRLVYTGPIILLKLLIIKRNKVKAFVFRYLNDNPSLLKTLLLLYTNIVIILICKLFGVKILWILHNVDRESHENFKSITKIQRRLLKIYAEKIFVTDPLLIQHAKNHGFPSSKLNWITFGKPPSKIVDHKNKKFKKMVVGLREKIQERDTTKDVYLGLCVSSVLPKFVHYLYADRVASISNDSFNLGLVVIGKMPNNKQFKKAKTKLYEHPNILYIEENFAVNEDFLSDEIDFIYRSVDDLSVSYSVYVAANIGKPIFTHDVGFLQHMVSNYNLGYVISISDLSKTNDLNIDVMLKSWDRNNADIFMSKRCWENGAHTLVKYLNDE